MHSGKGGAAWLQSQLCSSCVITGKSQTFSVKSGAGRHSAGLPLILSFSFNGFFTTCLGTQGLWMTTPQQQASEGLMWTCNSASRGNEESKKYMQVCINGKNFNLITTYSRLISEHPLWIKYTKFFIFFFKRCFKWTWEVLWKFISKDLWQLTSNFTNEVPLWNPPRTDGSPLANIFPGGADTVHTWILFSVGNRDVTSILISTCYCDFLHHLDFSKIWR